MAIDIWSEVLYIISPLQIKLQINRKLIISLIAHNFAKKT